MVEGPWHESCDCGLCVVLIAGTLSFQLLHGVPVGYKYYLMMVLTEKMLIMDSSTGGTLQMSTVRDSFPKVHRLQYL